MAALPLAAVPAGGQGLPLLPGPPPPPPTPPPLSDCKQRFGSTGCAARLYGEVLCTIVGTSAELQQVELQLQQRFAEEQIVFAGISVEQVEAAAVRYYVPQLCPTKSRQIWTLMLPGEAG